MMYFWRNIQGTYMYIYISDMRIWYFWLFQIPFQTKQIINVNKNVDINHGRLSVPLPEYLLPDRYTQGQQTWWDD